MTGLEAPVCLTSSAPVEAFSGQLVFYDVIEPSTVSRSGVLSCIAEAGGDVVLPDAIRLPEFRTWVAATNADRGTVDAMAFTSICIVLKVWHASPGWLRTLTRRELGRGACLAVWRR